ncbi:MAG: hypothetical protein SH848_04435 [Saprospiraceae bacterium]|nr:hypothetical protein [Saprospiraceae bacterium]MDZ4703150.1 hypothetical protein [Saprospiraceae bacterium]
MAEGIFSSGIELANAAKAQQNGQINCIRKSVIPIFFFIVLFIYWSPFYVLR